jgi:hypothetical protein
LITDDVREQEENDGNDANQDDFLNAMMIDLEFQEGFFSPAGMSEADIMQHLLDLIRISFYICMGCLNDFVENRIRTLFFKNFQFSRGTSNSYNYLLNISR